MPLTVGTRLGAYEIVAPLGSGGMGEVFRARDTKLKRDVAIKVLPEALGTDPDRVARFQREAELLAALNHPNIAAIYGIEDAGDLKAIVIELVEGQTLYEKLRHGSWLMADGRGPIAHASAMNHEPSAISHQPSAGLPLDEALNIARQTVDALEAAHDRGVIHRDLKPANIKITPEGKVKVLDFGLAKALETGGASGAGGLSVSPTLSVHATYAGVILGTAAYMSPEQARGKPVDRRTDIWSFGCVLYEMLTGKQAFEGGETVSDAIAAILKGDVDWSALPADTPPHVRSILRRCLQKDPAKRLPHIGVVRLELDDPPNHETPLLSAAPAKPAGKRTMSWIATVLVVGALAASVAWRLKPFPAAPTVVRFSIPLGDGVALTNIPYQAVAVSPDGSRIVYVANNRLYLRTMADLEARVIPGSNLNAAITYPVFSPDGATVAFWAGVDRTLKKVAVSGGSAVTLCPAEPPFGMTWDADSILFAQPGTGILRVSANGGKPDVVAGNGEEQQYGPQLLPDGQWVLFSVAAAGSGADRWDKGRIVAQSLKTGERKTVIEGGSDGRYLPTGHLVYAISGVLYAVPFDAARVAATGGPTPIVEGVRRSGLQATGRTSTAAAQFAVSKTGSLVYVPGPASAALLQQDIGLFDRKGTVEPLKLPPAPYEYPRVSPDGKQIAFGTDDGKEAAVWIYELSGKTSIRRITIGGRNLFPIWTVDGQRVAFQSDREGDSAIFWQRADGTGTAERITKPDPSTMHVPDSWSPQGDRFLFTSVKNAREHSLWTYSLNDKKATPFGGVSSRLPINSTFSADGRWVAYASTETGNATIYVQPYPATGAKYPISKATATSHHHPVWSPDGMELFYIVGSRSAEVVTVSTTPVFTFSNPVAAPTAFFDSGATTPRTFDMLRDKRLVGVIVPGSSQSGSTTQQLQVVLNWTEELKQRVPVK